ncbi:MAG: dihydrofolate reductase [Pseudomonadota bacterium]
MTISILVAMAKNRVIGAKGHLPWHISEDLKRFKKLTTGHAIVMGRKTFDSIRTPLPNRRNIVISRNPILRIPGVEIAHTWEEALQLCKGETEVFAVGGAEIYRLALPSADRLYLTLVEKDYQGDTFFPEFDWQKEFNVTEESEHKTPDGIPYRFLTVSRKQR